MSQSKNRTYHCILSLFKQKRQVTIHEMRAALEEADLFFSDRSLARIRVELRDLGFDLEYNSSTRAYTLDIEANSLQERLIQLMITSEFLHSVSAAPESALQHIDFDDRMVSKGIHFLAELFQAIKKGRWVEIAYQRYDTIAPRIHTIAPLFLKEYGHRWYVLAIIRDTGRRKKDAPLLFGLDRIVSLKLMGRAPGNLFQKLDIYQHLEKEGRVKPFDLFSDIVGVSFSDEPVQQVVLSFDAAQAPYIKSQPWHHLQEILMDNKNEFRIALYVRPNEDLMSLILSQCGRVQVMEPAKLKGQVKRILTQAVNRYK